MLISFTVENFLSFKEPATFSMLASNERIHPHHVVRNKSRSQPNILRMATIYGANASGKSNFVKALSFVQHMVVDGLKAEERIPIKRFRLDAEWRQKPAQFRVEFRVATTSYRYTFSVSPEYVLNEELSILTNASQDILFARKTDVNGEVAVEFGKSLKLKQDEERFLSFVARGTRPNQLLLHETIERNTKRFRPAFTWFREKLRIIEPTTMGMPLELPLDIDIKFRDFLADILQVAGTGIDTVRTEEVLPEVLPQSILDDFESLPYKKKILLAKSRKGQRFTITKQGDSIRVVKTLTVHKDSLGNDISFEIHEESDGTQRLFDFIPMLYQLTHSNQNKVFIIDEISRSLHPHLTKLIVDIFLDSKNVSNQLIMTTHETNLLDLEILRRDEIWFAEKRADGSSDLYSLADFDVRYDKNIEGDYLLGRYGAIPFIGSLHQLAINSYEQEELEVGEHEA